MARVTPASLRARAARLERRLAKLPKDTSETKRYTFSHMVMAGIMMMYFVGIGLGIFAVVTQVEELSVTLNFIMELARIVCLGYFVKAFGENIARIVLSAIFGNRLPDPTPPPDPEPTPTPEPLSKAASLPIKATSEVL